MTRSEVLLAVIIAVEDVVGVVMLRYRDPCWRAIGGDDAKKASLGLRSAKACCRRSKEVCDKVSAS